MVARPYFQGPSGAQQPADPVFDVGLAASGLAPLEESFVGVRASTNTFTPIPGIPFNIAGAGVFGSIQLEKYVNAAIGWQPITAGVGIQIKVWTNAFAEQWVEFETGVTYRLNCTASAGTINTRISQ